jgi:hypothetical protein
MSGTSEKVWRGSEIEKLDEQSVLMGYKVGPVDRPSTLPAFWNEAQAERWADLGFPSVGNEFTRFEFPKAGC